MRWRTEWAEGVTRDLADHRPTRDFARQLISKVMSFQIKKLRNQGKYATAQARPEAQRSATEEITGIFRFSPPVHCGATPGEIDE